MGKSDKYHPISSLSKRISDLAEDALYLLSRESLESFEAERRRFRWLRDKVVFLFWIVFCHSSRAFYQDKTARLTNPYLSPPQGCRHGMLFACPYCKYAGVGEDDGSSLSSVDDDGAGVGFVDPRVGSNLVEKAGPLIPPSLRRRQKRILPYPPPKFGGRVLGYRRGHRPHHQVSL